MKNDHYVVPLLLMGGLRGQEYRCLTCARPLYYEAERAIWRHYWRRHGWNGSRRAA